MRSSKAPPNQKNRGQVLLQPTRTHRTWHPNLLRVTLVGEELRECSYRYYSQEPLFISILSTKNNIHNITITENTITIHDILTIHTGTIHYSY